MTRRRGGQRSADVETGASGARLAAAFTTDCAVRTAAGFRAR
jgi:hypothetical protein